MPLGAEEERLRGLSEIDEGFGRLTVETWMGCRRRLRDGRIGGYNLNPWIISTDSLDSVQGFMLGLARIGFASKI